MRGSTTFHSHDLLCLYRVYEKKKKQNNYIFTNVRISKVQSILSNHHLGYEKEVIGM